MRKSMTTTIWMSWMSLVPRVMSEAAENRWISASENATTWLNSLARNVAPTFAAVREATRPTSTAAAMPSAAMPSMVRPMRTRYDMRMSDRL